MTSFEYDLIVIIAIAAMRLKHGNTLVSAHLHAAEIKYFKIQLASLSVHGVGNAFWIRVG